MSRSLPEVSTKDLIIWDAGRSQCCGYLTKKASKSSAFSKGKWQRRWFFINIDLEMRENYNLAYYHSPEEKTPRQIFPLALATIKISSGDSFVLSLEDGTILTLGAENKKDMKAWIDTLENVISVANLRNRIMQEYNGGEQSGDESVGTKKQSRASFIKRELSTGAPAKVRQQGRESILQTKTQFNDVERSRSSPNKTNSSNSINSNNTGNNQWGNMRNCPALRLDIDASTIPPSSNTRHHFIELFIDDLSKALDISSHVIEVKSVKPAPGMDWLTMVEWDINARALLREEDADQSHYDEDDDNEDDDHAEMGEDDTRFDGDNSMKKAKRQEARALRIEQQELRSQLLYAVHEMLSDVNSILFNGFVTCKLDPSYSANLIDKHTNGEDDDNEIEEELIPYSADPAVLRIMEKYKDIHVPHDVVDLTFFTIQLTFDGKLSSMRVPNPRMLRKRSCAVWPFEVKKALGFSGNMQELWIEPVSLVPRNTTNTLATARQPAKPILFEASLRGGGEKLIDAALLRPDMLYEVQCNDRRDEALNALSKEEMDAIKDTFQKCDINGDGGISRKEMALLVKRRTQQRRNLIEQKFADFIQEAEEGGGMISKEDLSNAESNKAQYLQSLQEAQNTLLRMFEAADMNGDGVISFTEFIMAEAWWLRCTINPERAHLF